MFSELHKSYQSYKQDTYKDDPGTIANTATFGSMAARAVKRDVASVVDVVKLEINDWRNAKLRDFVPRLPEKGEFLEGVMMCLIWAFMLPLVGIMMVMQVGDRPTEKTEPVVGVPAV